MKNKKYIFLLSIFGCLIFSKSTANATENNEMNNNFILESNNPTSTILSFEAKLNDNSIELSWTLASEQKNDFFTIERSINGLTFVPILKIKGAGTKSYATFDETPVNGVSYYRLTQTNSDKKKGFYKIVAVSFNNFTEEQNASNDFPNPSNGQCKITVQNFQNPIFISQTDAMGNAVTSEIKLKQNGSTPPFDTKNNLKPGVFIIKGSPKNQKK